MVVQEEGAVVLQMNKLVEVVEEVVEELQKKKPVEAVVVEEEEEEEVQSQVLLEEEEVAVGAEALHLLVQLVRWMPVEEVAVEAVVVMYYCLWVDWVLIILYYCYFHDGYCCYYF
jgi:hypothetical protein